MRSGRSPWRARPAAAQAVLLLAVPLSAGLWSSTDAAGEGRDVDPWGPTMIEQCGAALWPMPTVIAAEVADGRGLVADLGAVSLELAAGFPAGCRSYVERAFDRLMARPRRPAPGSRSLPWARHHRHGFKPPGRPAIAALPRLAAIKIDLRAGDGRVRVPGCGAAGEFGPASLQLGVDESYSLAADADAKAVTIVAGSAFGVVRALTTLGQLLVPSGDNHGLQLLLCLPLRIEDAPRYQWRGLMVDTARHYIPVGTIKRMIDGMEQLKLSVFHWHIVDSQSFPFESKSKPLLSRHGAYGPSAIYTHADVAALVQFCFDRAIRLVPEFDLPAHTASWGLGYPELTIDCADQVARDPGRDIPLLEHGTDFIGMHPFRESTYSFLEEFLGEIFELFPDNHLHLGGDEVNQDCWKTDPEVQAYAKKNPGRWANKLQGEFTAKVMSMLDKAGKAPIFWDEALDMPMPPGKELPKAALYQYWRFWLKQQPAKAVRQGGLIQSTGWYLDFVGDMWDQMYKVSPDPKAIGGEACSWSEHVSDANIEHRIFSRLPSIAEKLWSQAGHTANGVKSISATAHRFGATVCSLRSQRGVNVGPVIPDHCGDTPAHVDAGSPVGTVPPEINAAGRRRAPEPKLAELTALTAQVKQLKAALATERQKSANFARPLASADMVGDTATAMGTDPLAATVPKPDPTSGVQLELAAQVQRLETALSVSKAANGKYAARLTAMKIINYKYGKGGQPGEEKEHEYEAGQKNKKTLSHEGAAAALEAGQGIEIAVHNHVSPHQAPDRSKALSDALDLARRWQLAAFGFGALLLPPLVLGFCYVTASTVRFLRKTKTREITYNP